MAAASFSAIIQSADITTPATFAATAGIQEIDCLAEDYFVEFNDQHFAIT